MTVPDMAICSGVALFLGTAVWHVLTEREIRRLKREEIDKGKEEP